jgi:hypothetical protein
MAVAMKDLEIRERATCSAASSPDTSPTSDSTSTSGWWGEAVAEYRGVDTEPEPRCGSSCRSTRTCR